MKKNTVKLNEAQLRNIIAESVKKVIKEYHPDKAAQKADIMAFQERQHEMFNVKVEQFKKELSAFINSINEKYGDDVIYAGLMTVAESFDPSPDDIENV